MEYRDWILMVENNESAYLQQGPYSVSEIENLLKIKKIKSTDLAWRSGLDKWVPIQKIGKVNWQIEKLFQADLTTFEINEVKQETNILDEIEFLKRDIFNEPVEEIPVEALPEILPEPKENRVIIPKSSSFLFNFDHRLGFSIKEQKKPIVLTFILLFLAIMLAFALFLL